MDKIYDTRKTNDIVKAYGCYTATIRKNNNKNKNRDLDGWRSKVRMPFEGTFSKMSKHARCRGLAKNAMQRFLQAVAFNLKKSGIYCNRFANSALKKIQNYQQGILLIPLFFLLKLNLATAH